MRYYALNWVGTTLGSLRFIYLGQRRRVGFVLRILASLLWMLFGIVAGAPAGVIANVAVILLSVKAIRDWTAASRS